MRPDLFRGQFALPRRSAVRFLASRAAPISLHSDRAGSKGSKCKSRVPSKSDVDEECLAPKELEELDWSDDEPDESDNIGRKSGIARHATAAESITSMNDVLHNCPIFSECSYDVIEELILRMKKMLCRPGQRIVEEGTDKSTGIYCLLWGTANVHIMGEVCKTLHAPDCFGEVQLLDIVPRWQYSVVTSTSCMIWSMPRQTLHESLVEHQEETEYFSTVMDLGTATWREQGSAWKSLRRCVAMRNCSEAFLEDLNAAAEFRAFFPEQTIFAEGQEDSSLYMLDKGVVTVEIAGRCTSNSEVPGLTTRLGYVDDYDSTRTISRDSDVDNFFNFDTWLMDRKSSARAAERLEPQVEVDLKDADVPEAEVFGEATFLGISQTHCHTLRARKPSFVRIIYKPVFLHVLSRHAKDRELVEPFLGIRHEDVFPPLDVRCHPELSMKLECSEEFFKFVHAHVEERICPTGQRILFDDFYRYMHPPLPEFNISVGRLNRGSMQVESSGVGPNNLEFVPGSFISGSALLRSKVLARDVCYLSILQRGVIAAAFEKFPNDRDSCLPGLTEEFLMEQSSSRSQQMAKILRDRSVFAHASQEFLSDIINDGVIRVFMPGDRIIEQNMRGTSMFILWVGTANVVLERMEEGRNGRWARNMTLHGALTYGSVFGELTMLGHESKRTASIVARSVCCTWEVEHSVILEILERHPTERSNFRKLVEEHLYRDAAQLIIHHNLFAGFHQQFRTLIGVNCERKLYMPGDTIVRESTPGLGLYIINYGSADVQMHGQHVMKVKGGAYFGYSQLSAKDPKERFHVSVVATTMCQVLIVSGASYRHAISKYPEMGEIARKLEAAETERTKRHRETTNRLVNRRRKLGFIISALRKSAGYEDEKSCEVQLANAFQGWYQFTQRCVERRREEGIRASVSASRIEAWLQKRESNMKNVKHKTDMKLLIDDNLTSRGPLKMLKVTASGQESKLDLAYYSIKKDSRSPYMSPCPVWNRTPASARQIRRLPPLSENSPSGASSQAKLKDTVRSLTSDV